MSQQLINTISEYDIESGIVWFQKDAYSMNFRNIRNVLQNSIEVPIIHCLTTRISYSWCVNEPNCSISRIKDVADWILSARFTDSGRFVLRLTDFDCLLRVFRIGDCKLGWNKIDLYSVFSFKVS